MMRGMTERRGFFRGPIRGRHVLAAMIAFFAVIFAVNGIMVFFALDTFSGVHTDDAYRSGRDYNQVIDAARTQADRGWTVTMTHEVTEGTLRLAVTYLDRSERPVEELSVTAELWRPTHDGHDRELVLEPAGAGRYAGTTDLPLAGQWEIRLLAEGRDGVSHAQRKWILVRP